MSLLSNILILFGLLSLFHAAYSAHEFSSHTASPTHTRTQTTTKSLPLDIQLETLLSVFLSCLGFILNSDSLRPISWSTWAGKIEREGGMGNPFAALEERVGFVDVRERREEFGAWVKEKGGAGKS